MPYTDQTKIENYLKRSLTAKETGLMMMLLPSIDQTIDAIAGRTFNKATTTTSRYYNGTNGLRLWIDECIEVSLVEEVDYDDEVLYEWVLGVDYELYPYNETLKAAIESRGIRFFDGVKRYKITGKFGYTDTPESVSMAATIMAAGAFSNPTALKRESIEGYTREWAEDNGEILKAMIANIPVMPLL
jgi:hypothetical protein